MYDTREWNTDTIMLDHYEEMQNEVSSRKQIALDLKAEQYHTSLLQQEITRLKYNLWRVENERDTYKRTSHFQGP
jgi:hypothetical protein